MKFLCIISTKTCTYLYNPVYMGRGTRKEENFFMNLPKKGALTH